MREDKKNALTVATFRNGVRMCVSACGSTADAQAVVLRARGANIRRVLLVVAAETLWTSLNRAHERSAEAEAEVEVEVMGVWELRRPLGPPHAVLSSEERREVQQTYAGEFPRISAADPHCRWLGARVGDVVRVTRPTSDVRGVEHHFRVVVEGSVLAYQRFCLGRTAAGR